MVYRIVLGFVVALAIICPSHSADYEVNLSVLESLEADDEGFSYGHSLPVVAAPKAAAPVKTPHKKPASQPENKSVEAPKIEAMVVNTDSPATDTEEVSTISDITPTEETALSEQQSSSDTEQHTDTATPDTEVTLDPLVPVNDEVSPSEIKEIMPELDLEKQDNVLINTVAQPQTVSAENNAAIVVFDNDSDVLSSIITQQLDDFSEQAIKQNPDKILIEAYHYDNGENSFARKRLSLNRAVTVRSYLLNKGHKSFSIKIINTEDKDLQNNTVISY